MNELYVEGREIGQESLTLYKQMPMQPPCFITDNKICKLRRVKQNGSKIGYV